MSIQRSTACLPMPPSTLSSFRFPSNPISNSPFWQLKMGWWKLCKCALFVMLFFCIHPHHVFLTLQSSGTALALVQRGDSYKECMPGALTFGYLVWFSDLDTTTEVLVWSSLIDDNINFVQLSLIAQLCICGLCINNLYLILSHVLSLHFSA